MGAELGATSSVFPSDRETKRFLEAQGRGQDWTPITADADAVYDENIEIDLSALEPLAAKPHSPDAVEKVREIGPIPVDQICIGSCTNSSLHDMLKVAGILKGKRVHPEVSLTISPGSRQVLEMLARNGALGDLISSGARILETTCGPCIGMGQSPKNRAVSLRTFNRNFEGRSGTANAGVYLVSPEVAACSAINAVLTDPTTLKPFPAVEMPQEFLIDDSMILAPAEESSAAKVEVKRGPNIKPLPTMNRLPETICGEALIVVGDSITTDHIMPAGSKILPLRSNIPAISQHVFGSVDPSFPKRAEAARDKGISGFIIAGQNYGQGSSREHAALAPMYLGIKTVIAKSFARIHKANLVNFGILPLTFENEEDYDKIIQGDYLG
jgi:aconitate hydratase